MKRILLGTTMVLAAVNGFAQGLIVFNNRVAGTYVSHVYAPLAGAPWFYQIGNGTADTPAGTTNWSVYTLIGASGIAGQYGGSSTLAQLLIAPGANQPESSLVPATPIATFRTGAAAGFTMGGITVTANNVGSPGTATIEMVAWDNSSGLYSTWTQAFPAWAKGLIAAGESGRWTDTLGGFGAPPGVPPNIQAQSFTLIYVPEPCTFALLGVGAAMLLIARWRR